MRHMASLLVMAVLSVVAALPARAFETRARAAWVYDLTNDTVLLAKNADEPLPPASMSKLMTINMLFEALKDGRVKLDDTFGVSARAMSMGGSTMFLNQSDRPTAEQLIKGIIVNSGNDASVVVAEGLAGSEADFARLMTERAKALGMTQSNFVNASGWPDPGHLMSMHDLGILAVRLITQFPEYYGYFSLTEFANDGRAPDNRFNRNPLLGLGLGVDGLKTGHTQEAGFGMVGSAVQNGRRIVFAFAGVPDATARLEEGERIVNWAFREFAQKTLITKGTKVAEAPVWLGNATSVGLVAADDVRLLLPSLVQGSVPAEVVYSDPIVAPVAAGATIANLVITVPDRDPITIPLLADRAVDAAGFRERVTVAAQILARRALAAVGS